MAESFKGSPSQAQDAQTRLRERACITHNARVHACGGAGVCACVCAAFGFEARRLAARVSSCLIFLAIFTKTLLDVWLGSNSSTWLWLKNRYPQKETLVKPVVPHCAIRAPNRFGSFGPRPQQGATSASEPHQPPR